MPVEMIGWVTPQVESELFGTREPVFDHDAIERAAHLHEAAGFERALVGYFSDAPDGFLVAAHAATVTQRLAFLMAHRPGFVAPTVAARKFATLDHLTRGRASVHLIAGGSTANQAMDGDFVDHDGRYRRMGEYIRLMERTWTERAPFDHEGEFYRVTQAHSTIDCWQQPRIPIFGGGGSSAAIEILAPIVDVFMLWGEPLPATAEMMQRVRTAAGPKGAQITFSVSTRPILGRTDEEAWDRAYGFLAQARELHGEAAWPEAENVGTRRLLDVAGQGKGPRQLPMDRARGCHRSAGELHRSGWLRGNGGPGIVRVLQAGRLALADQRF